MTSKKIMLVANCEFTIFNFRGDLVQEMTKNNHDVKLVAPQTWEKVPTNFIPITLSRGGINPIQDIRLIWELRKVFQREKPDIILNYTIKPTIYSSIAARISGISNVYSNITGLGFVFTHQSLKTKILKVIILLLYRLALSFNKKVFFQNKDDRSFFVQQGVIPLSKTVIINGSGVDLEKFPKRQKQALQSKPLTFVFIGRLLRDKGIFELIEAAKSLKEQKKKFSLHIIGSPDPDNPNSLSEELIKNYESDTQILFLGQQDDIKSRLYDGDVFILPSYREGTPRSTLEAMATGMPVITTDTPGCRETVSDGLNGFLVPIKESQPLAEKMIYFLENQEKIAEMGNLSRQLAEERYDVKKVNQAILNTINAQHIS